MNYFKRLLKAIEAIADKSAEDKFNKFMDKFTSGVMMKKQAEYQSYYTNRTQLRQWISTYRVNKARLDAGKELTEDNKHHIEIMEQYDKDGILASYHLTLNGFNS